MDLRAEIQNVINKNAFKLKRDTLIYYGNTVEKNRPLAWPQFFGPIESASFYVKTNNRNRSPDDRRRFLLHEYLPKKDLILLNLTPSTIHSEQIQTLLDLITKLIKQANLQTMVDDLATVQLIALFINILFGLSLSYDETQIDTLVSSVLATKLSYPYKGLSPSFVKQILHIIHDPQHPCQASRISFRDYDKTLMNALTFTCERYEIPLHGLYFFIKDYSANACCHAVEKLSHEWLLCVPNEYIIFRPNTTVDYRHSYSVN